MTYNDLIERKAKISVIGLGYVGLPIALEFAKKLPVIGFDIKEEDLYEPLEYYEVALDSYVNHFADYASSYGVNYFILKMYNPWLRDNYLKNRSRKVYTIKLPIEGSIEIIKD